MTKTRRTLRALFGLAALVLALGCASAPETKPAAAAAAGQPSAAKTIVKCPVMGGEVEVSPEALHSTYKGKDYYFCCAMCKVEFDKDPEKYLQGK